MPIRTHSTLGEGVLVGVAGAVAAAIWYLVTDLLAGAPFRTPNALGHAFAHVAPDQSPDAVRADAVLGYSLLHLLIFVVMGVVLTWLVHQVIQHGSLRMALWLGIVIGFTGLALAFYILTPASGYQLPWWSTVGGAAVGSLTVIYLLWRQHPALQYASGDEAALGADEPGSPDAAPGQMTSRPRRG
jgi:hypothetical protein